MTPPLSRTGQSNWRRPLLFMLLVTMALPGTAADVLTLGRISDDPARHYSQLRPLLDYVVPKLREVGIQRGRILMARDARQMATLLRHARVDWVTETPGTAMQLRDRSGARLIALTERSGVREYRSLIVVRRDSVINDLAELGGRRIAFEYPASTSAYVVPAADMLGIGLQLVPMIDLDDRPRNDRTGYLFAHSETNVVAWVGTGLVDAGAISSLALDPEIGVGGHGGSADLRVIHASEPMPRAVELVRDDLDSAVLDRLRSVLLAAHDDPDADAALAAFFDTTAFLAIDPATERRLEALRTDLNRVRDQIE